MAGVDGGSDEAVAGDVYAEVIDELLEHERSRKASLEQKALAVITSSGVLVTLLFGFSSLTKTQQAPIPLGARILLLAALVGLLVAILVSLGINRPVDFRPLGVKTDLHEMTTEALWTADAAGARRAIAVFRVKEIDHWREQNGRKAGLLQNAIIAESAGVALLAATVAVLMFRGYPG
jgi:hypothetical protein